MYEKLKQFITDNEFARERRNRANAIVTFLLKQDLDYNKVSNLVDLCQDYESANRYWRQILSENENLRGTDYYEDKDRLEQEKQIELGYESGYEENVKKLNNL